MIAEHLPCGELSMGEDGACLCLDDVVPSSAIRDVTKQVLQRLYLPIPDGAQVAKSSMAVVGGQGCGKSVLLDWLVERAIEKYGEDNVHVVYCDDIRVWVDLCDTRPVQLVVVDDAMTNASSREVYKQTEIVKTYNRSRHVFEEKLHGAPGLVIYLWAWQRWGELDPAFRQADVILFKTGIAEANEQRTIESFLTPFYKRYLWRIWDKMSTGDNAIKSVSVARIASMEPATGVGKFVMPSLPVYRLPPLIRSEEYFAEDEETADAILDQYRDKPEWAQRIKCYELYTAGGVTQAEVARELGISRQGYVSESIRKVRELLKKK